MQVNTTPLKDFEKYVENIYEAIVIIAKRAKQINEEQKLTIEQEFHIEDENDIYGDEQENDIERGEETNYIKLPKPTMVALDEMLSGSIWSCCSGHIVYSAKPPPVT